MLPVYAGNNSVVESAKDSRNIKDRAISLNELEASFQQVL